MISISESVVNARSPYALTRVEELTFSLTTDKGVQYFIGFNEDHEFLSEGSYYFMIENVNGTHVEHDEKLLQTIFILVEEFFNQDPMIMLYVCDSKDKRQEARNRLFSSWFKRYKNADQYILHRKSIQGVNTSYYAGALMRVDNPAKDILIDLFDQFVATIERVVSRSSGK